MDEPANIEQLAAGPSDEFGMNDGGGGIIALVVELRFAGGMIDVAENGAEILALRHL